MLTLGGTPSDETRQAVCIIGGVTRTEFSSSEGNDEKFCTASVEVERVVMTSSGVRLVADRRGRSHRPPLLFLHGGGQTRQSWSEATRPLVRSGWETWCLDLRGHGESDWATDGNYSMEAFVADVQTVVDIIGRPPIVVGASLGGMIGLISEGELAPGRFAGVVLVDISTRLEELGVRRIVSFMASSPDGFGSLDEASDAIAMYRPERPRPKNLDGLRKNLRLGSDGRWRWHWDPRFLSEKTRVERRAPDRLSTAARRLEVPAMLVRGRESDVVSQDGVDDFLACCTHGWFRDVAEAGHMLVGDGNDVFVDTVLEFVDHFFNDAISTTPNGITT